MNRLLTILTVLLTTSCIGQDYSITDSLTQNVNTENVHYLIIECFCENGVKIKKTRTEIISIDVVGKLESVGYHGNQKTPTGIGEEMLSFKTVTENDTLRLVSHERTIVHHSFLIDKLKIQIPKGLKYEIVKIDGDKLERREIK
jgi:hypothetical protein